MVYVQEATRWTYTVVVRPLTTDSPLTEEELNALGAQGWELAGIVTTAHNASYYFKRLAQTAPTHPGFGFP